MAIFEDIGDGPFHNLTNSLFRDEIYLNKFLVESKAIMDARGTKSTRDLEEVKTIEWPTKREIYVWQAVGEIKALSIGRS